MAGETFVANAAVIDARFLLVGDVFECDNDCRYRVTGQAFTQLGTALLPVRVTQTRWGRRRSWDDLITIEPGWRVLLVGSYL